MTRRIVSLAFLIVLAAVPCVRAQYVTAEEIGYTPTMTFDVATIRPSPPMERNVNVKVDSPRHSSRFAVTNFTVKSLIQIAYGFDTPVAGGPDWMNDTFYDVQARSDEATDAKLAKLTDDQARLEKLHAIQVLLTERFGLKYHLDTRESSIYNLVAAKGGIKLKPQPAPAVEPGQTAPPTPSVDVQAHGGAQGLEFVVSNAIPRAICGILSSQLRGPVIDKTGLTGVYNFTLDMGGEWSANNPDSWPSIFTAVQEQLGLKLEATKAAVPNIIVDSVSKPTEN